MWPLYREYLQLCLSSVTIQFSLSPGDVYSPNSTGSTLRVFSTTCPKEEPSITQVTSTASTVVTSMVLPASKASTAAFLVQKSHEAAMAELKENIATSGASALLPPGEGEGPGEGVRDNESLSSLPLSVPEGSR